MRHRSTSDPHWTFPQLRARGWTSSLIARFLNTPDATRGSRWSARQRVRLYERERVAEVEASDAFREATARAERQAAGGRAGAARQRAARVAAAEALPIRVIVRPTATVLQDALEHYNERQWQRWRDGEPVPREASTACDAAFLARIQVNYVRHELTDYDAALAATAAKIGGAEARAVIRRRVFDAIATAYPTLAGECARQARRAT